MTLYRLDIQIFISRFTGKLMPDSESVLPPGVWRGAQRRRVFAIREKTGEMGRCCPSPSSARVRIQKNNLICLVNLALRQILKFTCVKFILFRLDEWNTNVTKSVGNHYSVFNTFFYKVRCIYKNKCKFHDSYSLKSARSQQGFSHSDSDWATPTPDCTNYGLRPTPTLSTTLTLQALHGVPDFPPPPTQYSEYRGAAHWQNGMGCEHYSTWEWRVKHRMTVSLEPVAHQGIWSYGPPSWAPRWHISVSREHITIQKTIPSLTEKL